jgi:hypothetical protein
MLINADIACLRAVSTLCQKTHPAECDANSAISRRFLLFCAHQKPKVTAACAPAAGAALCPRYAAAAALHAFMR